MLASLVVSTLSGCAFLSELAAGVAPDAGSDAQTGSAAICPPPVYTTLLDAGTAACANGPSATGPAEESALLELAGAGFTVHRNWTYDVRGGRALQGDLYIPHALHGRRAGLIVGIHGGGWEDCNRRRGNSQMQGFLARLSKATGAPFFVMDYRLSQEGGQYPENLKDVRCALQYALSRIAARPQLKIDVNRVVVIGESAGAQLALMLGLTQDRPDLNARCSYQGRSAPTPDLRGVYAFSPPTDLPGLALSGGLAAPSAQHYTNGACAADALVDPNACGCASENRCVDASPLHHVCHAPPNTDLVVVHAPRTAEGEYDLFLPFVQAERLRDAFRGAPPFQLWVPTAQSLLDRGCYGSDYIIENGVVRPDGSLIPFAHGFMECLTDAVFPLLEVAVRAKVGAHP